MVSHLILIKSAAFLGYETTRTALPEKVIAEPRYKAEVEGQDFEQRGTIFTKRGANTSVFVYAMAVVGLHLLDGKSLLAVVPILTGIVCMSFFSIKQLSMGQAPVWLLSLIRNHAFISFGVLILIILGFLAKTMWVQKMTKTMGNY